MRVDRLRESPVGQLVKLVGTDPHDGTYFSHWAFLPNELPADLPLDRRTWWLITQAHEALGRLRQVSAQLPNPRLLLVPALSQEAVATSALEGTFAPLAEVMEARLPQFASTLSGDVNEILGYERMAEQAFEWISERPITVGMLADLQGVLMESAKEVPRDPGRVRRHQVLIGPKGCRVEDARFVPVPPGDQLAAGLEAWQRWINSENDLSSVVRLRARSLPVRNTASVRRRQRSRGPDGHGAATRDTWLSRNAIAHDLALASYRVRNSSSTSCSAPARQATGTLGCPSSPRRSRSSATHTSQSRRHSSAGVQRWGMKWTGATGAASFGTWSTS